ncbi:hypothetical protein TNCV_460381 [Trichonephila clavipes]|nr:hypothetical protein TNCV_460381 [Trichonephila clavipes]
MRKPTAGFPPANPTSSEIRSFREMKTTPEQTPHSSNPYREDLRGTIDFTYVSPSIWRVFSSNTARTRRTRARDHED